MSSAIRKLQRDKSTKPRTHRKKGPATMPRRAPPPRVIPTPEDGKYDLTKADPACHRCHGAGWGPTIVGKDDHRTKLICACVSRGMAGGAPWTKGKE